MSQKVVYQITRYKMKVVEVENAEQETVVKELNRDFERIDKADKTYRARCSSLDYMSEIGGFEIFDETQQTPEEKLIKEESLNEIKIQVHKAMDMLTPRQKEMVKMVYFDEKTQDEVALHFGISKQAVSNAMKRIYDSMRKFLQKSKKF